MKVHNITSITPVTQDFLDFPEIVCFQRLLHFDVGRSQIEWNVKVNFQFSHS